MSPDIQNIPYTPDNEHLGMERERDRETEKQTDISNISFLPYSISFDIKHHNFSVKSYTVMLFSIFTAIPCINDEDKSVADAMRFSYDDVVDENYIVKSGQVNSRIL